MVKSIIDKVWLVFKCGSLNIRKWSSNPRMYIIAFLVCTFLATMLMGVRILARDLGLRVTPWIFPFLLDNTYILFFLMLGVLLLFCDAPFIDAHQPHVIVRTGKRLWALGQIVYIALASFIYFAAIFILTNIMMLPHWGLSDNWGKILGTLAQTDAGTQYNINMSFDYNTMLDYTPLQATAWSFFLAWLVAVFLGLMIFVINESWGRGFGTAAALFLILMPFFVAVAGNVSELFVLNMGDFQPHVFLHYFSPVSWAALNSLDLMGNKPMPSREFAVCALIGLNGLLCCLSVWVVKRKGVHVDPSV